MHSTYKIIDSKKFIANKIIGRGTYFIVLILALLVIDRSLEGGFANLWGFSRTAIILIWIALIGFVILSIYLGMLRYELGKISISESAFRIDTIYKNMVIPTNEIPQIEIITNNSKNRADYGRSILSGGKNYLSFKHSGAQYKFEIFLESVKDDTSLSERMRILEKGKNIKINWA